MKNNLLLLKDHIRTMKNVYIGRSVNIVNKYKDTYYGTIKMKPDTYKIKYIY